MLDDRIAKFAPRKSKGISYRETGAGQALVLLHGIGSSSASWLNQLETLKAYRLIAWDAPGYGDSEFLPEEKPLPVHYAQALHGFLDRMLLKDVVLVGNSLGCLMAGAYAAAHPERVRSMILLDPAAGHAGDESKQQERLKQFEELGPEGLAEKRSPTLVGKNSPAEAVELMRWTQRRIRPPGYRQAVHCLTHGRLAEDARKFQKKVLVACGSEDIVTPEASCKAVAAAFPRCEYRSLAGLGHVPHMEAPETVNRLIRDFVA
ncbi:MAG TPA: alpha/beta hydrolase [Burkholderiales bacterium]|nr:alpha/beta hydrolase [Burkholderiales bacterium]